ncbi:MAG: toll/interleukin-1 receptor domain-containing protein [Opitutales bacterium]|nr:toll/interleukin-1 receptor domain-containing protein [Opitutales bacterium]
MTPKIFISYSWTNKEYSDQIREWADRLISDGIDTIIDQYDLKRGNNKYAFMESMVTDESVTHVLIFSDKAYTEKANQRSCGVGTESVIISQEIYEKTKQSKFIPIVTEFDENNDACLPVFLKSLIWVDFSTPEKVNEYWEALIRDIYGKSLFEKPKLGKTPSYISDNQDSPRLDAKVKYEVFKQAFLNNRPSLQSYRSDFLESAYDYIDKLRIREKPKTDKLSEKILEDSMHLTKVRNLIVDWVLLEGSSSNSDYFNEIVIDLLEKLIELRSRPEDIHSWNEGWFTAHRLFAYETFIYIIAALIKILRFDIIHDIYKMDYISPPTADYRNENGSCRFDVFFESSDILNEVLAPEGIKYHSASASAEFIKRHANRSDLTMNDLIQADLLTFMMFLLSEDCNYWKNDLRYYAQHNRSYPLFFRASQRRFFKKIAIITGIDNANDLRKEITEGIERNRIIMVPYSMGGSIIKAINMANWDTVS